jgi:3'(2'), 5'-bisphosphate nucleotidase
MLYEKELDAALTAARMAGQLIRDAYAAFAAIPDASADITTDADRAAQEAILIELQRRFPEDAFCAEEATPALAHARREGPRQWIIDPIDGTRGFAQKNGEFSVMVGLVDDRQPVVGVVYEPARERMTRATREGGCWCQIGDGMPLRCHVSTTAELASATLTQSRSKPGQVSRQVQALRPAKVFETHSAGLKLALVARGEADLYVNHYAAFHDWDICAGHILVEEAGGKVSGLRGEPILYGSPGAWQRSGLLASNGVVHQAAVAALAELRA